MRTLHANLTASQKAASATPYPQLKAVDQVGGVARLAWTRLYTGAEADNWHDSCMTANGSLHRFRVAADKLYYSLVTSPGAGSTYNSWSAWLPAWNWYAVSVCASGASVWFFGLRHTGHLYISVSTDSGAGWSALADMGAVNGLGLLRLASAAKSTTEAIVLYADGYQVYRNRLSGGAWEGFGMWDKGWWASPTSHTDASGNWTDETNIYDDDTGTFGYRNNVPPGAWSDFIELNIAAVTCSHVRFWAHWHVTGISTIDVDVFDSVGLAWVDVYQGTFADLAWDTRALAAVLTVNRARVRFKNDSGGNQRHDLYEFDFGVPLQITGLACHYDTDWNVVITGTEAITNKPGVWTTLLGDGGSAAADVWTDLEEHYLAASDANMAYKYPTLDQLDTFRLFFVEALEAPGVEAYSRPYWSYAAPSADWIDNSLREPVPFNLASSFGLALCHDAAYAWATRPDGVWRAPYVPTPVELTANLLQLKIDTRATSGGLVAVLRNDDGRYNTLGSGTYEAIKLGAELQFSPGYVDSGGTVRVSDGPRYWITGWEYATMQGRGSFTLHAVDGWGLLERWKARQTFSWDAETLTIEELIDWVHARAGLEYAADGALATETTTHKPAFMILPGDSGRTAVMRLLGKVHDLPYFRGATDYLKDPQAGDSSDYTYGTDHAIIQGRYGQQIKPVNRAQVIGDDAAVFTEDFDWDEVELVGDILSQVADTYLDSVAKAHRQGDAIIRHADIEGLTGEIVVMLNAGQELYDVVTVTDPGTGLSGVKRRVLGLLHVYHAAKGQYTLTMRLGDA